MTSNDIATILAGVELTDVQVKALLDVNSADITKALNKQKDDLVTANDALKKAQETITALEANKADVSALQRQIDQYKQAEAERAEAEKRAQEEAELEARFSAVAGDKEFIHDMVREGVKRDFGAALKDKKYLGQGDAAIFEALTKDKGYFASQNPTGNPFPKLGDPSPLKVESREAFFKLSFADQMRFKKENAAQFEQMFHAPKQPTT